SSPHSRPASISGYGKLRAPFSFPRSHPPQSMLPAARRRCLDPGPTRLSLLNAAAFPSDKPRPLLAGQFRIADWRRCLVFNSAKREQASVGARAARCSAAAQRSVRRFIAVLWLCLLCSSAVAAGQNVNFDIPPSSASDALGLFARQADVPLLFPYYVARAVDVNGLKGSYLVDDGIRLLLRDSCLSAVSSDSRRAALRDHYVYKWIAIVKNNDCYKTGKRSQTIAVLSVLGLGQVYAQEPTSGAPKARSALMEEVVVTARKRAVGEAVQDTPIAMTAYGAEQFKAVFADNLDDLGKLSPGVELKPSAQVGAQNFTIRGMGVSGTTPSDESAVGIFQDGIYWGSNYGALLDTFDVESIQILRGPQ